MGDEEINRIRNYGKKYIPQKSGAAHYARLQDEKLMKEHAFELNKRNVCPKCNMIRTKMGKCSMGCDE